MPAKTARRHHAAGPKHKHTKTYLQHYWPYIPMVLVVLCGVLLGNDRPRPIIHRPGGVLSYATNTNSSDLLQATNVQRAANGKSSLSIDAKLSSAAQAKANDMVARNYWSHITPDGLEPWVFIQKAGYSYTKAGENLAYGFATSNDTINGWMNSPSHKANLLDGAFSQVGFGIANSENFNNSGQETIVVAMYAQPQVLSASTSVSTTTPAAQPSTTKPAATAQPQTQAKPAQPVAPAASPAPTPPTKTTPPTNSNTKVIDTQTMPISKIQVATSARTQWLIGATSILAGLAVLTLLLKHSVGIRKSLRKSEKYLLRHPLVDTLLVTAIMIAYVLNSTSGFIK